MKTIRELLDDYAAAVTHYTNLPSTGRHRDVIAKRKAIEARVAELEAALVTAANGGG